MLRQSIPTQPDREIDQVCALMSERLQSLHDAGYRNEHVFEELLGFYEVMCPVLHANLKTADPAAKKRHLCAVFSEGLYVWVRYTDWDEDKCRSAQAYVTRRV